MQVAPQEELDAFIQKHPDVAMLEVLMPDMSGIFRCKRIHKTDFQALFNGALKSVASLPLVTTMGSYNRIKRRNLPKFHLCQKLLPVAGSLAPVPWLSSPTGQVLASHAELDGGPAWVDPRNVLARVLERFTRSGLTPVIATEMEFYLIARGDGVVPRPLLGRIPGTGMEQQGI